MTIYLSVLFLVSENIDICYQIFVKKKREQQTIYDTGFLDNENKCKLILTFQNVVCHSISRALRLIHNLNSTLTYIFIVFH